MDRSLSHTLGKCPMAASRMARRPAPGFTLIELMVVVSILVILIGVVAPSFRTFLEGQQVKGLAYDLTTDLLIARSEALKRGTPVTITPSGGNWSAGWVSETTAGDRITTRNQATLTVTFPDGSPASLTFKANGRADAEMRMTISGGGASRCVEVGLSGRARSSVGACT